jgi:hypothetical protein
MKSRPGGWTILLNMIEGAGEKSLFGSALGLSVDGLELIGPSQRGRQHNSGKDVQERPRPAAKPPGGGATMTRWFSKILESAVLDQSTAYEALVTRARRTISPAASDLGPRRRPAAKTKRGMRRTDDQGGLVKKDPTERLVDEEHDPAPISSKPSVQISLSWEIGTRKQMHTKPPSQLRFRWEEISWLNGGRNKYECLRPLETRRCQSIRHGSAESQTCQKASRT